MVQGMFTLNLPTPPAFVSLHICGEFARAYTQVSAMRTGGVHIDDRTKQFTDLSKSVYFI